MGEQQVDILIIGGGLTGATLMLALQGMGFSTLLVEAKPFSDKINADFDARSLALSPASQRILSMLGLWERLKAHATPIHMIHVSDQHRFGASRLNGTIDSPLGYVLEMQHINQALNQRLDKQQLMAPASLEGLDLNRHEALIKTPSGMLTIKAQLIVAADGAESTVRKLLGLGAKTKEYKQQAIVANIGLNQAHQNKAYERFTAEGPLALLPMQEQRMSLVWAMSAQKAAEFMALDERAFLAQLQRAFGYRLGRLAQVGVRHTYSLKQRFMPEQAKWPVVFVGNAAHTLHPVAGQGFNLGLRDVASLAQCIVAEGLNQAMLDKYLQMRAADQQLITGFTDALISLFTSSIPGVGFARDLGLIAFDNIPFLKKCLARYAQGFSGVLPDLVCQIPLDVKEKT